MMADYWNTDNNTKEYFWITNYTENMKVLMMREFRVEGTFIHFVASIKLKERKNEYTAPRLLNGLFELRGFIRRYLGADRQK